MLPAARANFEALSRDLSQLAADGARMAAVANLADPTTTLKAQADTTAERRDTRLTPSFASLLSKLRAELRECGGASGIARGAFECALEFLDRAIYHPFCHVDSA